MISDLLDLTEANILLVLGEPQLNNINELLIKQHQ